MKRILTVFVATVGTLVASAQESPQTLSLSLFEAQEFAVEHNRTLANASIDVQKAQAAKWQAAASMLPQVKVSGDYSNYFGYKMNIGGMSISMPPYSTLGVTSSIAFSGAMVTGLQMAEISKKMSDINVRKSERDIRNQVETLYYSILVTEESLSLLRENLKSMESLAEISQNSVNIGVAEQTDADQLKVQVASMKASINSVERSLEMAYNFLRLQLTVEEDVEIQLTQKIEDILNIAYAAALMDEQFDIDRNYDFQLLRKSTDLAKKQIASTFWSNGPVLSIYHQYSYKHYFSDEMTMNMTPPNMMGIQLSIPIFTSGKTASAIKDAKLSYRKQMNTMKDTELALNVQHRQLVYNLRSSLEKYSTQKQSVDVARRVFDNIARKYEYGVASSLDVTNAGTSLLNAQNSYVQSLLEIVEGKISLEELLNK
ncbi:MAG: TolC family protein [Bacteroidales bacterium]|nr:TolC family protein [Candidatus Cacconaster merdequi]